MKFTCCWNMLLVCAAKNPCVWRENRWSRREEESENANKGGTVKPGPCCSNHVRQNASRQPEKATSVKKTRGKTRRSEGTERREKERQAGGVQKGDQRSRTHQGMPDGEAATVEPERAQGSEAKDGPREPTWPQKTEPQKNQAGASRSSLRSPARPSAALIFS